MFLKVEFIFVEILHMKYCEQENVFFAKVIKEGNAFYCESDHDVGKY